MASRPHPHSHPHPLPTIPPTAHTPANASIPLGRSPSTRGLRADHLMNFRAARSDPPPRRGGRDTGPPRRQQAAAVAPPRRPGDDRARHLGAPGLRFLVSDAAAALPLLPPRPARGGLATALAAATTSAVPDWDDVAAVVADVFPGLPPSCPITLSDLDTPSSAPVLTPCGHAFAAAALAAHIAARGGGAAPCPLCYARVGATDARALLLRRAAPVPAEGDVVNDFVLVRRPRKGGRVAVVEDGDGGGSVPFPFEKATPICDAAPLWAAEATALAAAASSASGTDAAADAAAAVAALDALAARAGAWAARRAALRGGVAAHIPGGAADEGSGEADAAAAAAVAVVHSARDAEAQRWAPRGARPPQLSPPPLASARPPPPPPSPDDLFFYQHADGAPVFLAPLDARVLASGAGGYGSLPPRLPPSRVVAVESHDAASPPARAARALDHLPPYGTWNFVSLDLAALAPPDALAAHAGELAAREKRWAARAEKKKRARAAEAAAQARAEAAAEAAAARAVGGGVEGDAPAGGWR